MENQGFEEEHQHHRHQSPRAENSGKLWSVSAGNFPGVGPDGHVYEDISTEDPPGTMGRAHPEASASGRHGSPSLDTVDRPLDGSLSQEPSFSSCSLSETSFQRNLSLPFRRGTALDPGTNCSVRVTTRERGPQWPKDTGEVLHDVRPSRRRRKKDCKHCRNKEQVLREPVDQETVPSRNRENENENGDGNDSIRMPAEMIGPLTAMGTMREEPEHPARARVFAVTENGPRSPLELERNEDKGPIVHEDKGPVGMRVNSIYSQDRWYAKEAPIFFTDVKEHAAFQRAYSLPVRTQSPASQNRVNLRRSVRGEPPPQPARLHKHRHGWTLHLARPLEGAGPSCTRSLVLLLILLLALLGVGAVALYIVFEPEKLQIIQQYLRSSSSENATERSVEAAGILVPVGGNRTILLGVLSNDTSPLPDYPATTVAETEAAGLSNPNRTRHCDDCLPGEVCVALVDEEVPICRLGLDNQDPTGCAGFCLINKQRCHRLDVDAFRCVEVEHYCLEDEWTCLNTLCIPLEKHCDGHMNCYDHSDEYNCACDLETHFQCGNETSCLPLEKRCDGKIDCWDAADEINCTLACPLENEFTCSDGQCILKARFCDGLPDCADGSDEPHGCQGRCNKHEFTCQNSRCITKGMKCNGLDDCGDGSDERHCKERF